jgi:hypothetical protein
VPPVMIQAWSNVGEPCEQLMAPKKRINWDAAFADWISLPKAERQPIEFARRLTVARQTLFERMKKEHWEERAALIDERVRRKLEAEGVRKLEERNRDSIGIIEVFRRRYAQRLVRDRDYKPTAMEFAAMIRTERLIEGENTVKVGGEITEEFRERVGRLPVYVQERLLVAAITGATMDELLEVEGILEGERTATLNGRRGGSGRDDCCDRDRDRVGGGVGGDRGGGGASSGGV